jgi:histidinol-phosphate aminotransferase
MSGFPAPRDSVRALEGYHSPQLDVAVRLNTNESPFPPLPALVEEWTRALRAAPLHRYPDRAAKELRAQIGKSFSQPDGRVFAANGSNEVLQTLLLSYGGPGREALVFEPTYALHEHISRITDTEVVVAERDADFRVGATNARTTILETRPHVVFLCSPNNPTGTVETRATIETVLSAAVEVGHTLVIVDEAYGEFADFSALDLVDDNTPLVVARTYSKVWSLAAVRLGFCIAPRRVVEQLEKVVLPYHLSVATQLVGTLALNHEPEMRDRVSTLIAERHRLAEHLRRLPGLTVFPSGANFILVRSDGDGQALWEHLVAHGVLVRNFARWPRLENCLRITIGTPEENDACVAALIVALEELS